MTPAGEPSTAIDVRDLVVRHGTHVAVDGVSLTARAGEVLALLGPNGAGKTSTVETIEGFRRPSSGSVRVLGRDPVADHAEVVGRMGVMLQDGGIANQMRVGEALRLFAAFYPDPMDPAALADTVGLTERWKATYRTLSGGERQRLSLALAVIGRPDVVLLDEPTSGVDPLGRDVIRTIVADLAHRGVCVVLTTHDLADVERLADVIVVLDAGRVAAAGSLTDLTAGAVATLSFTSAPGLDCAALAAAAGVPVSEVAPGRYEVAAGEGPEVAAAVTSWLAAAGHPLGDLRTSGRSLEDVYRAITTRAGAGEPTP